MQKRFDADPLDDPAWRPPLWQRFSFKRTSKTSRFLAFLRNHVGFSIRAPHTNRDIVARIAKEGGIPIESMSSELVQPVFARGQAIFGCVGDELDEIARNYPFLRWWVSDKGLNMAVFSHDEAREGTRYGKKPGRRNARYKMIDQALQEIGDAGERIAAIDRKIENIRRAVEEGLNDARWANTRLRELHTQRESLVAASRKGSGPPQLDAATAMDYRRQADKLLRQGGQAERKQLLRTLVEEVKLMPEELQVSISYRLPEAIMNGLVAGDGFEPPTFGL